MDVSPLNEILIALLTDVQAINPAFLLGKSTQAATFGALGMLTLSLPLGVMALIGLRSGMWLRDRVAADAYRGWLRGLLWFLVGLLVLQFFRDLQ